MGRIHLFEFLDQAWFPGLFKKAETDYLEFCVDKFNLFEPSIPLISQLLNDSKQTEILDLGSGGGGPWRRLFPVLKSQQPGLKLTLTDVQPNQEALSEICQVLGDGVNFHHEPVNALKTSLGAGKVQTLFLALHHFKPESVSAILKNIIENNSSTACFEAQKRSLRYIITSPIIFLMVLVLTPFLKRKSLGSLIFTYVIPVIPLCITFDGVVSALRTYSEDELWKIVKKCDRWESYNWDIRVVTKGSIENVCFSGWPKDNI